MKRMITADMHVPGSLAVISTVPLSARWKVLGAISFSLMFIGLLHTKIIQVEM